MGEPHIEVVFCDLSGRTCEEPFTKLCVAHRAPIQAVAKSATRHSVRYRLDGDCFLVAPPTTALSFDRAALAGILIVLDVDLGLTEEIALKDGLIAKAMRSLCDRPQVTAAFSTAVTTLVLRRLNFVRALAKPSPRVNPLSLKQLVRIDEFIQANIGQEVLLDELARLTGLSAWHFIRRFRGATGVSPHTYVVQRKLEHAAMLIVDSDRPIAEIASAISMNRSHFSRAFSSHFATSPRDLRMRGRFQAMSSSLSS